MSSLELGLIGNSRTSALIDRNARIVWWCYPAFDSDPVCCDLLDPDKKEKETGFIDIGFEKIRQADQYYERNSAVLVTRFGDNAHNVIEIIDFAPCFPMHDRLFTPSSIIRIIRRIAGRPRITIRIRPGVNYGSETPQILPGAHHISYKGPQQTLRVTTDASISSILDEKPFFLNDSVTLVFGPDQAVESAPLDIGRAWYEATVRYWQNWIHNISMPFEWQDAVIRAAITLRMNTFYDTGAIIAAVTTSVPGSPDARHNRDYRYSWVRDSYFVVSALNRLGATGTMERYLQYILNIIADSKGLPFQPVYGIHRNAELEERIAPALAGYNGMGPVRIGNSAYRETQNDVYGSAILACTQAFFDKRLHRPADRNVFTDLERLGEEAVARYNQPDADIWHRENGEHVHTFSSIMCWAACDRLAAIAKELKMKAREEIWTTHAAKIRDDILANAYNEKLGTFTTTWNGSEVDASLLLMAELRFLEPEDERFRNTVSTIEKRLLRGDFLLRYENEDSDGLPDTALLVCTFWWILALAYIGETERARAGFGKILARRNRLGLLSADVSREGNELWGNFPQTYSMVGLIQCAVRLSMPWENAF